MKRIRILLFMAVAVAALTAGAAGWEDQEFVPLEMAQLTCESIGIPEEGGENSAILQATEDLEGAMEALRQGIWNGESSIDITAYNVSTGSLQGLLNRLKWSSPELFAVGNNWSYSSSANKVFTVTPTYRDLDVDYAAAKRFYLDSLNEIVEQVDPGWSDLEKVLFVHDYLAANYEYDGSLVIHDAYNFFKQKTGVCESYTMAFTAVMQELKIPVSYVQSSNLEHIWNLVQLDGSWYHVDVTFDDPGSDRLGYASHGYFLCSDSGLEDHDKDGMTRDWVYGVTDPVENTCYDDAFWKSAMSPFVNVGDNWYYLESEFNEIGLVTGSSLMRWDGDSLQGTTVCTDDDPGKNGLVSVGSGMGYFQGKLYFNTYFGLYSYDLETGELKQLVSGTSGSISGCRVENGAGGPVVKYEENRSLQEYIIDLYTRVSDLYGYYQSGNTVYLDVTGENVTVVLAGYDSAGRMRQVKVFGGVGKYTVSPGSNVDSISILAVSGTGWDPVCGEIALTA